MTWNNKIMECRNTGMMRVCNSPFFHYSIIPVLRGARIIILAMLISTWAFTQKRFNAQFVIQPGNSFIAGQWRNIAAYNSPLFEKKFTPGLETGVNVVVNFRGKAGKKVVYDEMYESGFYLADKIAFNMGIFYSFGGQNYKDMKQADITWLRKLRLQYLKIPLKFDFIKGKENELQLIYTAGFYLSYLIGYKETNSMTQNNYQLVSVTQSGSIITTSSDGTFKHYPLESVPYNSIDYGASLGVGMQKKLSTGLFLQLMLTGQRGFVDIKNTSSQYRDGSTLISYFGTTVNTEISHKNSSLEVMLGLKKIFTWTPSPKSERKLWRIFRFKQ